MKKTLTTLLVIFLGANANAASPTPKRFNSGYNGAFTHNNNSNNKDEIYKKTLTQSKDLEAVLISKMIEPMFPRGKESGLYGGGEGSDIYRAMMIQEYGKVMAKGNGLGLAENMAKNLTKQDGVTK